MIIMITALVLAVLFFFVFDIKTNFEIRTGRAKQLSAGKIGENNTGSGKLKRKIDMDYTTSDLIRHKDDLSSEKAGGGEDTLLLDTESQEPLQQKIQDTAAVHSVPVPIEPVVPKGFKFYVTENIMVIHTNELI